MILKKVLIFFIFFLEINFYEDPNNFDKNNTMGSKTTRMSENFSDNNIKIRLKLNPQIINKCKIGITSKLNKQVTIVFKLIYIFRLTLLLQFQKKELLYITI